MRDIQKEDYAEWLESSLRQMVDFQPTRIAIAASNNRGETATAYWQCDASDKAQIAAVIQQDGPDPEGGGRMNEAVLISIKPQWCDRIISGEKTIEVRKTRPKLPTPFKCYIYCTLKGSKEYFHDIAGEFGLYEAQVKWNRERWYDRKGKVIGEFVCDQMYSYEAEFADMQLPVDDPETCLNAIYEVWHDEDEKYSSCVASNEIDNTDCRLFNDSCLTFEEIRRYVGAGFWAEFSGWHISDLKIYDTPKELSEFYRACPGLNDIGMCWECDKAIGEEHDCGVNGEMHLSRPPQSWCYVKEG